MAISPALAELRAATQSTHDSLDQAVDPLRRLRDPATRLVAVRGYHAMHASVEAAMAPHLSGSPTLRFAERCRADAIAADLRRLGGTSHDQVPAVTLADFGQAMGALYVMEGSTLGGRMILRGLADAGADVSCLGFLDPYGHRTGAMWRGVLDGLDGLDRAGLAAAIIGARAAFAQARACLCDPLMAQPAAETIGC